MISNRFVFKSGEEGRKRLQRREVGVQQDRYGHKVDFDMLCVIDRVSVGRVEKIVGVDADADGRM